MHEVGQLPVRGQQGMVCGQAHHVRKQFGAQLRLLHDAIIRRAAKRLAAPGKAEGAGHSREGNVRRADGGHALRRGDELAALAK